MCVSVKAWTEGRIKRESRGDWRGSWLLTGTARAECHRRPQAIVPEGPAVTNRHSNTTQFTFLSYYSYYDHSPQIYSVVSEMPKCYDAFFLPGQY